MFQCSIVEMRQQEADLEVQMREQCDDYKELLNEKMARDMEIAAYRSDVTHRFLVLSIYHVSRNFSYTITRQNLLFLETRSKE